MENPEQNFLINSKERKQYVKQENKKLHGENTSPQIITQESRKHHTHPFIQKRVLTTRRIYYNGFFLFWASSHTANAYSIYRKLESVNLSTIVITFKQN